MRKTEMDAQMIWEDRINRAKAVRKSWKDKFRVDLGVEYFEGAQRPPGVSDDEWITVNKIYSHVKSQLPSLYSADPYFYVKLKRSYSPDPKTIAIYEEMGNKRAAFLNYLKDEIGLKIEIRMAIQDAFFKYGVVKTYYHADVRPNPDAGNPMTGEDGLPMIDEETSELIMEPESIPTNERYCVERVHPDDFLWDEDSGTSPKTWKWQAQRIVESMENVRKNPIFDKKALKKLEGKEGSQDEEQKTRDERKKGSDIAGKSEKDDPKKPVEDMKTVTRWEIYNLKANTWTVIAEGADIPLLLDEPLPKGTEKTPFDVLRFTLREDSPYPIPPVSMGLDPQREFNTARSSVMTHRKRFNRKYEFDETGVNDPETEMSKLTIGGDGTIIRKRTPAPVVTPISDAPLDQMRYLEINALNNDMIELLGGSSDESRGIAGADSATQASILDKRMDIKEGDAMSMVIDFVKGIARKLDQLVQANIDEDQAVRILGPDGEMFWSLIRTDDYQAINGEYEYDVNVGSTMPKMPQMERASLMAFLQLVSGAPLLATNRAVLKRILEMHHIEGDSIVDGLMQVANQMVQMMSAGAQKQPGSVAGVTENKPEATMGGQAGGPQSLNLPLAGNEQ